MKLLFSAIQLFRYFPIFFHSIPSCYYYDFNNFLPNILTSAYISSGGLFPYRNSCDLSGRKGDTTGMCIVIFIFINLHTPALPPANTVSRAIFFFFFFFFLVLTNPRLPRPLDCADYVFLSVLFFFSPSQADLKPRGSANTQVLMCAKE